MKELLENKVRFDKVTFAQIKELLNLLDSNQKRDLPYIKERYERVASNFLDTVNFLEQADLISKENHTFDPLIIDVRTSDTDLCKLLITKLLKSTKRSFSEFKDYLENFVESGGVYSFQPTLDINLSTSGLRNLLIQLRFIRYNSSTRVYVINSEWNFLLKDRKNKLSAHALSSILKNQERLGTKAEQAVINYEREVLGSFPELISKITHVALDDVRAGYDIRSARPFGNGNFEDRYIEVKAVSGDRDFYWSINEVEVAKSLRKKYHLYLLPVLFGDDFDFDNMIIISDPYTNLFKQENSRTIESVSFHVTPDKNYFLKKDV